MYVCMYVSIFTYVYTQGHKETCVTVIYDQKMWKFVFQGDTDPEIFFLLLYMRTRKNRKRASWLLARVYLWI